MTQFFNKTSEKEKRRSLRNNTPSAEAEVWSKLKGKQILGQKFRRQYGVGRYVIDFYCPTLNLAVEIDGDSHYVSGAVDYDKQRQAFIESFGISFLRFTNQEVWGNMEGVLEKITTTVQNCGQDSL